MNKKRYKKLEKLASDIDSPLDFMEEAIKEDYAPIEIIEIMDTFFGRYELFQEIYDALKYKKILKY